MVQEENMSHITNDALLEALVERYMENGLSYEDACAKAKNKFDNDEPFPDEEHRDDSMFGHAEYVEEE